MRVSIDIYMFFNLIKKHINKRDFRTHIIDFRYTCLNLKFENFSHFVSQYIHCVHIQQCTVYTKRKSFSFQQFLKRFPIDNHYPSAFLQQLSFWFICNENYYSLHNQHSTTSSVRYIYSFQIDNLPLKTKSHPISHSIQRYHINTQQNDILFLTNIKYKIAFSFSQVDFLHIIMQPSVVSMYIA